MRGVALSAGNVAIGAVFVLGDPARTSGPSFTYLRDIPGGVAGVGWAFVLSGAVAGVGSWTRLVLPERAGHFVSGVLSVFLVACFWAARHFPTASLTGVAAYATLAAAHLLTTAATARPRHAHP